METKSRFELINLPRIIRGEEPYPVTFDELSWLFSDIPGENQLMLILRQELANNKLHARGYIFLNEVLEIIGLPWVREGQYLGRTRRPNSPGVIFHLDGFDGDKYEMMRLNVDGDIRDAVWPNY